MDKRKDVKVTLKTILLGGHSRAAEDRDISQQSDPFASQYKQGKILKPPYDPVDFASLPEAVDIMPPIGDALSINIEKQGGSLRKYDEDANEDDPVLNAEYTRGDDFVESCNEEGMDSVREAWRNDLTFTGNGWVEVLRETATMARARKRTNDGADLGGSARQPYYLVHAPSFRTRICVPDEDSKAQVKAIRWRRVNGKWTAQRVMKTFRKFAQVKPGTSEIRYFKELGDPRDLHVVTGKYAEPGALAAIDRATELWHTGLGMNGKYPYGVSKFAGAYYAIGGLQKAEGMNYLYFDNKGIPPLVVMVSGGVLAKESEERLKEKFEETKGIENFHSILILEGVPFEKPGADAMEPGAPAGQMKIEIKPLTEAIQNDALFMGYIKLQHSIIRGVWRVPPILMGQAQDYSFATAFVSLKMFEEQVCRPERPRWDAFLNQRIFPELGVSGWYYESQGIHAVQMADVASLVSAGASSGAGDPNVWGKVIGQQLGVDFPNNPDFDGKPISLILEEKKLGASLFSVSGKVATANEIADLVLEGIKGAARTWERMSAKEREAARV